MINNLSNKIRKLLYTKEFRIIKSTRTSDGRYYYYIKEKSLSNLWCWDYSYFKNGTIATSDTVEGCEKLIQDYVTRTAPCNEELVKEMAY